MEILAQHLDKIIIPTPNDRIYKDECVFSYDNPETETGLYLSLTRFIGVGREYVEKYFEKTGDAVFLHLKTIKREIAQGTQGDGPEKKITRLAIGVDGGFNANAIKYEYEHCYAIAILPGFHTIPWPCESLPEIVRKSVQRILDSTSANKMAQLETLSGTWDGELRSTSKFSTHLEQINNGKKVPPTGWKCEQCDKVDNLWLNLSDGSILCGRKFFDGSGGNNHAVDHYKCTGYPLAVKLGTITKEGKADIFSYVEDDMVEDPLIIQHLAHWGINIAQMEKTEKSMSELELELNQKKEWAAITESDGELCPIYGPGYTGMENMGNSCYLNSVMQLLFALPPFIERFYKQADHIFFKEFQWNNLQKQHPADNFLVQAAKMAVGLLSEKYSSAPAAQPIPDCASHIPLPHTIRPIMFKTLIGKCFSEFATACQQDAQEFYLRVLELMESSHKANTNLNATTVHEKSVTMSDPSKCFKYVLEERVQCSVSKMVKYLQRSDVLLPLTIPMNQVINKEEVSAYEARKLLDKNTELVRPKVEFMSCLRMFSDVEDIPRYYSSGVKEYVTAKKTTRLATFPPYLVIQLKKFMIREDWIPIKLDVQIDMPDELDLEWLRGTGKKEGEVILPDISDAPPPPSMDTGVIEQLLQMGFPHDSCKRAIFFTRNTGLEAATQWLMEHYLDQDFADPFTVPGSEVFTDANGATGISFQANPESVKSIMEMGFSRRHAEAALKNTNNNLESAMEWIFSHPEDEILESGAAFDAASSNVVKDDTNSKLSSIENVNDGPGKYRLKAFISHMGTSSMVGHYVVHIKKENRWVIYNDERVALSERLPRDLGYLYLYERI